MSDDHERSEQERLAGVRHRLAQEVNASCTSGPDLDVAECRRRLSEEHGQVWDSDELARDFEVLGYGAPLVVVRRREDGQMGSLVFQHSPRFYWGWEACS